MQAFIGRVPVSVRFDPVLPRSLVPLAVALMLGHSRIGHRFMEVLTTEYEGRSLTTDVECEVVSSLDNSVVLGLNWLFVWHEVWWSQLGTPPVPKCIAGSPASCTVSTVPSVGCSDICNDHTNNSAMVRLGLSQRKSKEDRLSGQRNGCRQLARRNEHGP